MDNKREYLQTIEIFKNFSGQAINKLERLVEEVKYPAGNTIFSENDFAENLYIIVEGEVIISKKTSKETEKILATLGPKSLFGEISLFSNLPRTASARTKTEMACYKIQRDKFREIYSIDPDGAIKTIELFLLSSLERLEQTSRELATIYEISKIIIQNLPMQKFCEEVMKQICYSIPELDDSGILFLYNEFIDEYVNIVRIDKGQIIPIVLDTIDSLNPLIGFLKLQRETLITDDEVIKTFLKTNLPDLQKLESKQFIICPLTSNIITKFQSNRLTGFILFFNQVKQVKYGSSVCDLMNSITNLLIGAIENIRNKEEEEAKKRLQRSKEIGSISSW